jgi:uncharacterized protein (TIGR02246 family)
MNQETKQVLATVSAFAEAWNQHDMVAFGELFAPGAEFVNVDGLWWKGKESISAAHALTHASTFKDSRLTILSTQVRFLAEEIAIARSKWSLDGSLGPDGEALPQRTGMMVSVLRRVSGAWKIMTCSSDV